jgi:hypothetical protein
MNPSCRSAFTLVEMMILGVAAAVMLVLLSPVVHHLRSSSGEAVSMANLTSIGAMHTMYAADWSNRQYTALPDDLGVFSTSALPPEVCTAYVDAVGCYPSQFIGLTASGGGFYSYIAPCIPLIPAFPPPSCSDAGWGWPYNVSNLPAFLPGVATFRFQNLAALNVYANGRWYDELFYSPTDAKAFAAAQPKFDDPAPMDTAPSPPIWSSYCSSPAAMFHPDVLTPATRRGPAWQFTFVERFKSPTISECQFPDLKTQVLEHNWNQNPPAEFNPAVADGNTPYQFNHGLDSAPLTLFFDGHVSFMSMATAVDNDMIVKRQTRKGNGLWSRDTPLGPDGYLGSLSFDGTKAGQHMLTIGGITGRDVLVAP